MLAGGRVASAIPHLGVSAPTPIHTPPGPRPGGKRAVAAGLGQGQGHGAEARQGQGTRDQRGSSGHSGVREVEAKWGGLDTQKLVSGLLRPLLGEAT